MGGGIEAGGLGTGLSGTVLEALAEETAAEVEERRAALPLHVVERRARAGPPVRDFAAALRLERLAVVAEVKAASPSAGAIVAGGYDPAALARRYEAGGAAAVSVLCQRTSFGGDPEHLREVRRACSLPVLRKDFVIDPYQIFEGRALGADAVLLIVGLLSTGLLEALLELVRRLGMEALVEAHSAAEVAVALEAGARVVGVNNRDLRTLQVDKTLAGRLRALVPREVVYVAESGIAVADDALALRAAGVDAILVGEALLRTPDPGKLIAELSVS